MSGGLRVGVDSGGTFTDICVWDGATGRIHVWKVSSTPSDPSDAIAAGVAQAVPDGGGIAYFGHGTTVATNALITGRGAQTGLITTAGFRDLLELRRQKRDSLYDIQTRKPPILASRDRRLEVHERVLFDGTILTPIDEAEVRAAARRLRDAGVGSVAVCLLFSFLEPAHEQVVKRVLLEEVPNAFISVSHEVAPEFREYERLTTTVVNAYLGPIMRSYLRRLRPRLAGIGVTAPVHLTQSNGGVISSEAAQAFPVRTVLSGPAAGVAAARALGGFSGHPDLITFDMGGTSTDVALLTGGRARMAGDAVVHGYPLKLAMLDIHTVGAGGGSIAHVDPGGLLKVGPQSAGADPGPVCYGRGNEQPTVTDANVVLGVLNPIHLLRGRMPIDAAGARTAIARLAERLGLDLMDTAQGIVRVVVANMVKAIRVISVERGYDPRDYALLAFGGAGPIHAARLARELEIPRVIVPRYPGIMCALGLLLTDLRADFSLTRMQPLTAEAAAPLAQACTGLEARAEEWFAQEAIDPAHRTVSRAIDMRYGGQGFELTVPCPPGTLDEAAIPLLRQRFEGLHRQTYGYVAQGEPIQVTTLRLEAIGQVPKAELRPEPPAPGAADGALTGHRQVWLPEADGFTDAPLYDRDSLGVGHTVAGPAVIDQMDSTTLVLPGQRATVDPFHNLVIEG